ncbi:MAG: hypothetical protein M3Q31_04300 [Actinomycetota bacterium]|nr:hypothetical protein [Actinomycetota bacterium]
MGEWEQRALVARERRGRVEARRDREVLAWIARFRFVTVEVLAERFSTSVRRADSRVSALAVVGLVECRKDSVGQRRAVFVSRRGAVELGLPPRRAPRPEVHRTHELAIARLAARIERDRPDGRVFTEREGRRLEAGGEARFSVDVIEPRGARQRRWPDLVVEVGASRVALEIEIAAKTTERLARIVSAYATAGVFTEVRFLAASAPLALRLAALCERAGGQVPVLAGRATVLRVAPWPGAEASKLARIESVLARGS